MLFDKDFYIRRLNEMELRDINEIKAAIKYMDYKPALLAKFYDVKSLLFNEIIANEEFYKVDSIMPNPLNDNKIIKCMNILDKKYIGNKEVFDGTKSAIGMPDKAAEVLRSVNTKVLGSEVFISIGTDMIADLYISIPRANSINISKAKLGSDVWFGVMNAFNTYVTEGFTFSISTEDISIAIEPSALEGIKGQGDVFVYVMTDNAIYKDYASNYFETKDILSIYRG